MNSKRSLPDRDNPAGMGNVCYFGERVRCVLPALAGRLPGNGLASDRAAGFVPGFAALAGLSRWSGAESDLGFGRAPGFAPPVAPGFGPDFIQGCLLPPDLDMPGFWGRAMLTTIPRSIR